jgi:UDP-glucuronate 4-epimerase
MRIIVTGAAGFIGSTLCEALLEAGHAVVGVDNFDPFYPRSLKEDNLETLHGSSGFEFVEGDIRDSAVLDVLAQTSADCVVHLAGQTDLEQSVTSTMEHVAVNVNGTVSMLEFCRHQKVGRFVLASTCIVYGGSEEMPFVEEDPAIRPLSPYAFSKRSAELAAYSYYRLYGLDVTVLRLFSVYGPRQRPEMAISKFTRMISSGQAVPVYGDGSAVRDYCHVLDVVSGILLALKRTSGFDIFNLGSARPHSLTDMISSIETAVGRRARIERRPARPGELEVVYASCEKARRVLGYEPRVELSTGIAGFVEWYVENGEKIELALNPTGPS